MRRRYQSRRSNGRWQRNTAENTLGLHFNIHGYRADGVTWCGALNPSRVGDPRPTICSHCGERLEDAGDETRSHGLVIVRGGRSYLRVIGVGA